MSELLPEGENFRRAVKWISEMRQRDPSETIGHLIENAAKKYDLGPLDEEFLWKTFGPKPA